MTLMQARPTVSFRVNGEEVSVREDHPHLLAALREELGIISPKDGCAPSGQCGCCTVLVNGKAIVSCQMPLSRVKGREVVTLEGLDPVERDRLARGFAATGALQCGFCTPGIVIRAKALIDQKGPALDRKTINGRLGAPPLPVHRLHQDRGGHRAVGVGGAHSRMCPSRRSGQERRQVRGHGIVAGRPPLHRRPGFSDDAPCRPETHRSLPGRGGCRSRRWPPITIRGW